MSNNMNGGNYTDDGERDIGIFQRISFELRESFFSLKEPNGRYVHVANSFAPDSPRFHHILLLRVGFFIWSIVSLGMNLELRPEEEGFIYMAYLTNQGFIISILYQLIACVVTFYKKSLIQPNADSNYEPTALVKTMWFLYFASVQVEIVITILYWTLEYPTKVGPLKYPSIYIHGIIALMLIIDGNLICRIPLKIKQVLAVEVYVVFFQIWTVIHAFSGIGDGNNDSGSDLLYDVIDWKGNPIKAWIIFIFIYLVLVPIIFLLIWVLSLAGPGCTFNGGRRPLHNNNSSDGSNDDLA